MYSKQSCSFFLAIPIFGIWLASFAVQGNENTTVEDFFGETPLVLTGSRMSKPMLESPASITIIDRDLIISSGARQLTDLFQLVPGFIVGYKTNSEPVVTYQGMGHEFSRQLQVLIDGRSVFIPSFGGVPWVNLPLQLEDIERIEVIRGPNAVIDGANAFLASINIITRHAAEDIGRKFSVSLSEKSDMDIRDAYLRAGYHYDDIDWRISLGVMNDTGFDNTRDEKEIGKINFRLDYTSLDNQFWTFQFGSSNTARGVGRIIDPTNPGRTEDASNSYLNIRWDRVAGNTNSTAKLTYTVQDVDDTFNTGPYTFAGIPGITSDINYSRESDRLDLELTNWHNLSADFRIAYGASTRLDRVHSWYLFSDDDNHRVDTHRLFAEVEWRINPLWLLDVGASLEHGTLTADEISPRLSVIRTINQNHALRFVVSTAKRNPILWEANGLTIFTGEVAGLGELSVKTLQGNPEIKPENIISYEIGLSSKLPYQNFTSDIKLFTYEITDHIIDMNFLEDQPPFGPLVVDTYANGEKTRVTGIEAAFDVSPINQLTIKSGISLTKAESTYERYALTYPELTEFVHVRYRWQRDHEISASLIHVDELTWFGRKAPASEYDKINFRYAYQLNARNDTYIELIGTNLLSSYSDFRPVTIQDERYFIRLKGEF